ncbi:hypothetical protein FEP80_03585 [Burkholderia multivorans]|nr:hypothetical protein [Burkholderia multivorans]MDR8956701.1 hypothetical protein [Burkholderia multivorans]
MDRIEQYVAVAILGVAEQVVRAGEALEPVRAELVERREHRSFAAAVRQHRDVLLAKAERQRVRDRALGRVDAGVGERVGRRIGFTVRRHRWIGPVERAARTQFRRERFDAPDDVAHEFEHVARAAVVRQRLQRDPARQRDRFAHVEVLQRILEPPPCAVGREQPLERGGPRRVKILSLVDDQHIEAPAFGDRRLRKARLELFERAGRLEVGHIAAVARDPVAQLVIVRDRRAGRRDACDVVGERPVEADVQHALAGRDRIAHRLHGELRLAGAGGARHAQPERRELELPRPGGEAARQPRDERAGLADERARVGRQRELVGEKVVDLGGVRQRRFVFGQDLQNHLRELRLARRIDDAVGRDARDRGLADRVVGAIQQRVDPVDARAERGRQPPVQRFLRARELDRDVALGLQIHLHEPFRRLAQETGLQFDQQHAAGRAHDDERGLAEHGKVLVGTRPVHAVVDGVAVRQRVFECGERFAFAFGSAGRGEIFPVVGDEAGHGVGRRMPASRERVRLLY